ncbi:MAG: hypothetical protein E6R03_18285 [Hyphomicrobiaceae bacterium]|nr:MAG: hypothetical protein E6R03_18285 [Hyphomicrobiaceae bacterium]
MTRKERWEYRLYAGHVRKALFGKAVAKLPDVPEMKMFPNVPVVGYNGELIGTFTFRLFPFEPRTWRGVRVKSSKHRVEVQCPRCLKFLPAGRLHQHIGTAACDKE